MSTNGNSSLIDLALVSNTALLQHCSTIPPIANSDHNGLQLSFKWRLSGRQAQQPPRTIWRYRNADFRMACQMFDDTDWDSLLPEEDIDTAATNWHRKFMDVISIVTALLAVTHDWLKALESRHNVCSVFLDLRKAFDSVPHRLLLEKLNTYALDSRILSWLHSYLAERKQHVVVGGDSSPDSPVLSGVPQGSVLGPLLFLIYIDDVSSLKLSENTVLNLYADDMLLYKEIKCSENYQQLQLDIDKISSWVDNNHLSLNPAKCKTMLISRKRNLRYPPQFLLNKVPLEQVEAFKYLGVLISSDLSWSMHI